MKHEFSNDELIEFAEWFYLDAFVARDSEDGKLFVGCFRGDIANQIRLTGTPDECAAFLINEWRKSRGGS